jgi:hypothetical protein
VSLWAILGAGYKQEEEEESVVARSLMSGARLSNFYVAHVPAPPDGPLWVGSSTVLLDKVLGAACCWQ